MKKAFKVFAMALVASAMMFACTPDNGDDNNDPNNPGGNEPKPEKVSVTFGAVTWDAASVLAYNYESGLYYYAFSNADEQTLPITMAYVAQVTPGEISDTFDEENFSYTNDKIGSLDYYEEYILESSDGSATFGDWWAESATVKINSYDATSLLINATINATMFSAYEAYTQGGGAVGMQAASRKNLTVDFNWTLTMYEGKAPLMAQKSNKLFVK